MDGPSATFSFHALPRVAMTSPMEGEPTEEAKDAAPIARHQSMPQSATTSYSTTASNHAAPLEDVRREGETTEAVEEPALQPESERAPAASDGTTTPGAEAPEDRPQLVSAETVAADPPPGEPPVEGTSEPEPVASTSEPAETYAAAVAADPPQLIEASEREPRVSASGVEKHAYPSDDDDDDDDDEDRRALSEEEEGFVEMDPQGRFGRVSFLPPSLGHHTGHACTLPRTLFSHTS